MNRGIITQEIKEQARIFELVAKGELLQREAAERLDFSERWVRKKIKRYAMEGINGLLHRGKGKPSKRKLDQALEQQLVDFYKTRLQDAGPTYTAQKAAQLHEIKVSKETMRTILMRNNLWHGKVKQVKYRRHRERRPQVGLMVQLDGSNHHWFEERGPRSTLLVFIDDATSAILWLQFVQSESTEDVMTATKNYMEKHGIPCSFYVDRASVFKVNVSTDDGPRVTQFSRAMQELNVEMIYARSAQAKGRVERCNRVLQERLVLDLRLANISTMEEANAFVQQHYIHDHNQHFAVEPQNPTNAHRSLGDIKLHEALCIKETRVVRNDYTITHKDKIMQIKADQKTIVRPNDTVTVVTRLDQSQSLLLGTIPLRFCFIDKRPATIKPERKIKDSFYKPPAQHPWRSCWSDRMKNPPTQQSYTPSSPCF